MPAASQRHQRTAQRRDRIARQHQPLALAEPVGVPAGKDLDQARHRLGAPLDEADHGLVHPKHAGQKQRHQRVDHLGTDVHAEAHQPGKKDVAAQPEKALLLLHLHLV